MESDEKFLSPLFPSWQSMRVSAQLGDTSVDTVHLLVGMLREGSGVAGSVLASHNIDAEAVLKSCKSFSTDSDVMCRDVFQLLGHQDRFDQWLADQPGKS